MQATTVSGSSHPLIVSPFRVLFTMSMLNRFGLSERPESEAVIAKLLELVRVAKAVVLYGRILGVANRDATALFIAGRVAAHFVVFDECFASGGPAYLLEADAGPTVVDHEVVVYPETVRVVSESRQDWSHQRPLPCVS